jgi:hypothetical protein
MTLNDIILQLNIYLIYPRVLHLLYPRVVDDWIDDYSPEQGQLGIHSDSHDK